MKIINRLLFTKNFTFTFLVCLVNFSSQIAHCQTRVVSGYLVDNDSNPLPGVNIVIKGTTEGAVTDLKSCYEINCDLDDILMYSFIGYLNEEITVTEKNSKPIGGGRKSPAFNKTDTPPLISSTDSEPKILNYLVEESFDDSIKNNKTFISEFSNNSKNYLILNMMVHSMTLTGTEDMQTNHQEMESPSYTKLLLESLQDYPCKPGN